MNLRTEMLKHLRAHDGCNAEVLAEGFLRTHTKAALAPMLAEEFDHLSRERVRSVEVQMMSSVAASRGVLVTAESVRGKLGDLGVILDESYRIGDGEARRAGAMTERDWLTRKAMLSSQRDGIDRAIAVCDMALEAIRRAGVRTLDEIQPAAVAA